jgi:hypothetical protein
VKRHTNAYGHRLICLCPSESEETHTNAYGHRLLRPSVLTQCDDRSRHMRCFTARLLAPKKLIFTSVSSYQSPQVATLLTFRLFGGARFKNLSEHLNCPD